MVTPTTTHKRSSQSFELAGASLYSLFDWIYPIPISLHKQKPVARDHGQGQRPRPQVCRARLLMSTPATSYAAQSFAQSSWDVWLKLTCYRDDRFPNTYRPRSPAAPRIDSYRSTRSPARNRSPVRNRSPRGSRGVLAADTYTPGGRASRPRSRSPVFRRRSRSPRRDDDRWRARPRSPPRRGFSPRRDDYRGGRGRSPRRDEYDSYTRSPRVRERSPLPPRERDPSPAHSRGMRSPLRASRYEAPRSRAHRYAFQLLGD